MTVHPRLLLRALGRPDRPDPERKPQRLSDPAGDVVTRALVGAGHWRFGAQLELSRDGSSLDVRVFLPEQGQNDRTAEEAEARAAQQVVTDALRAEGYLVRFSDTLRRDKGSRGWDVVVKAKGRG